MAPIPQPPEHAPYNAAYPANGDRDLRVVLRREKIAARLALPTDEQARLSLLLAAHLEQELMARAPGCIALCAPIRGEFDARPLIARLIEKGWQASMPAALVPDMPMVFRRWTPDAAMTADPFGIPIPADDSPCAPPGLVLLPLVAFDAAGYRLGYGGGYFDRTLAGLAPRPVAIGVGFELAAIADIRPGPHDIPLDAVVTESGVRRFERGGLLQR